MWMCLDWVTSSAVSLSHLVTDLGDTGIITCYRVSIATCTHDHGYPCVGTTVLTSVLSHWGPWILDWLRKPQSRYHGDAPSWAGGRRKRVGGQTLNGVAGATTDTLPNSRSPLWRWFGSKCQYEWWRTGAWRLCLWPEISPSVNLPPSNSNSNSNSECECSCIVQKEGIHLRDVATRRQTVRKILLY